MSQAVLTRRLDGFLFTWPDNDLEIVVSRIREARHGALNAEITVSAQNGKGRVTLTQQSANLLADATRTRLAKSLKERYDRPDWTNVLEQICIQSIREVRRAAPIESLEPGVDDSPVCFVLNPFLYQNNPTIIYGPGGSKKSFFALWLGMVLASGATPMGLAASPESRKVLYLDWEMSVNDLRGRVKWLREGHPTLSAAPMYRRCHRSLADDADELMGIINGEGYEVLIIDSLGLAAGGAELEKADSAIRFNSALRGLNVTSLLIGHTPGGEVDQGQSRKLYGNVYFSNLARTIWEARQSGNAIGLYHRKNNLGPEFDPKGFRIDIQEGHGSVSVSEFDIEDDDELSQALPPKKRIMELLQNGPAMTSKQVADALDIKLTTVRKALQRHDGKGPWISIGKKGEKEKLWTSVKLPV